MGYTEPRVRLWQIEKYRDRMRRGDTLKIRQPIQEKGTKTKTITIHADVIRKYPRICETDMGFYRWIDLYLWNNGYKNDR